MRITILCIGLVALVACRTRAPQQTVAGTNATSKVTTAIHGRIAKVHSGGQFVVLRFPPGFLPRRNQVLKVYRDGTNIVGTLKVTGLYQDITTVADILSGEPQIGDEVRGD